MVAKAADNSTQKIIDREVITGGRVALGLAVLFAMNLLLRVFYLRYDFVNGDEGVRALSALRMLEGARLYVDVVTDKPPGTTFFYAAVFSIFGHSMKAVHMAAILWNYLTAIVVFKLGCLLSSRRLGLWAAFVFAYFTTNYLTQDTMAANTELLMVLPYTAAFYFFALSLECKEKTGVSRLAPLFAAGFMTGLAILFKQVAVFNLLFFAAWEVLLLWRAFRDDDRPRWFSIRASLQRVSAIASGFLLVLLGGYAWLAATGAVSEFWRNAVVLGLFYAKSEPFGSWLRLLLTRGTSYILFNAALTAPALIAAIAIARESMGRASRIAVSQPAEERIKLRNAVVLWCVFTAATVLLGGRFFGHYFIPSLPALSLLAALGLERLLSVHQSPQRKRPIGAGLAVLCLVFVFGVIRFHSRTAVLAYETITGKRTSQSQHWGMTQRQDEAVVVSRFVRARLNEGEPLYIWGYAHDVFWQTRCRPATRYLTPYFIDGRFPDAETTSADPNAPFWVQARANLLDDLRRTRPRLILEVYGGLRDLPYPEIVDFIRRNYRDSGSAGPDPSRPFRALELIEAETSRKNRS